MEAGSGDEAPARLDHEGKVELLLSDLHLPEMSRVALALEFRKQRPGIQVLFVSGSAQWPKVKLSCKKPFGIQDLLTSVRNLVGPGLVNTQAWSATSADLSSQRHAC
jgi:CheY-like chemotaxis protein